MDSNACSFVVSVAVFLSVCGIFRKRLVALSLFAAVVLTPLAHVDFMPQNTFGIAGISLVNVVILVAAVALLRSIGVREALSNVNRYFTWPMLLFGLLFSIAVLRTAVDVEQLAPRAEEMRPTAFRVLVLDGLLSLKYLIVGFLVALYGIHHRTLGPVEKALLTLPMVLCPIVASFFFTGALGAGTTESAQTLGRDAVSQGLGIHANYLGRMALYLLLFALTAESPAQRKFCWISIFCSIVLIELSMSRTTWIVAPVMVAWALRRRPRLEWVVVAACVLVVTVTLWPYVSERSKFGFRPKASDERQEEVSRKPPPDAEETFHRVMAGRTGNIWPAVLPIFFAHPWLGQGLYSVWRPVNQQEDKRLVYDHPHNAYLEVALDMGLVGVAALGWLLYSFWQISGHYRPFRYLLMAWTIMCLSGDSFYPHQQNALNWIVLGMGVCAGVIGLTAVDRSTASGERARLSGPHPQIPESRS